MDTHVAEFKQSSKMTRNGLKHKKYFKPDTKIRMSSYRENAVDHSRWKKLIKDG